MQYSSLGIHISDSHVKIVQLRRQKRGWIVAAFRSTPIPEGTIDRGTVKDIKRLSDTLASTMRAKGYGTFHAGLAVGSLPERVSFLKQISIPPTHETLLFDEVHKHLSEHFPAKPDELYIDVQPIGDAPDQMVKDILVAAAPKTIVDDYVAAFEQANIHLGALEIETVALTRSVMSRERLESDEPSLIVYIGLTKTVYALVVNGVMPFTDINLELSGTLFTEAIAKKLNVSLAEAEKAKRLCGLDTKCAKGQVASVLKPYVQTLVKDIKRHLTYYDTHYKKTKPVKHISITGGASNLLLLPELCAKLLRIRTTRAQFTLPDGPLVELTGTFGKEVSSYPIALGLALSVDVDHR